MQNRMDTAGAQLNARVKQAVRANKFPMECLIYAGAGFVAANAVVMEQLAPFGVALAASVRREDRAAACIGASLGYLIGFTKVGSLKYILAMVTLVMLRWMFSSGILSGGKQLPYQAVIVISLGMPAFILPIVAGGNVYDLILALAEVLSACCAAYFFKRTLSLFHERRENPTQSDITSIIITFGIMVIALLNVKIFNLSLGRMLAATVILIAARAAKEAGGAIAGVAAGVSVGMLGGGPSFFVSTYGLGGLLAGVFAPLGRIASAAALIVVNLFAILASGNVENWNYLAEIFVAGAASIMFSPELPLSSASSAQDGEKATGALYKALLNGRISFMSAALRDVAITTRKVNARLAGMVENDISSIYHCAATQICRKCQKVNECWISRYVDTSNVMNDMLGILRRKGVLKAEDFPEYFSQQCQNLDELSDKINILFMEHTAKENVRRKASQVRAVVTDQFEGMALMIDAMGLELDRLTTQDSASADRVRSYLESLTVFPDRVTCAVDNEANMKLEITIPTYKLSRLDLTELTIKLGELCEREFDLPAQRESDSGTTTLSFPEKATYVVRWGAAQYGNSQAGSKLCGDSYSCADGYGRINLILSDGMGSGGAAAVDSTMTAELLKRLIEAGVSMDAALKLVNSALLVKSGDESLATIDITGIDLYTGRADFYKAGAAPTFLRKSGKSGYVESKSLPVGILSGVSFEKNSVTMREGDWVVMVTDGAVTGGYDWILSDLEHYEGDVPKALAEKLAAEAKRRRTDGHEDDITVLAAMIQRGL